MGQVLKFGTEEVELVDGRVLLFDPALGKARWYWPVDARDILTQGLGTTLVPEGVTIPPHPEPSPPARKPQVPAVPREQAAGRVLRQTTEEGASASDAPPPKIATRAK